MLTIIIFQQVSMYSTYLRSSSYNKYDWCEQAFFGEYVLGHKGGSNQKAEMGNVFHKVFECLALIKIGRDKNLPHIDIEDIGVVNTQDYHLPTLIDKSYQYYVRQSKHDWTDTHYKDIVKWVDKALEYRNGLCNPLNLDIVDVEKSFDIEIKADWAKYDFTLKGKQYKGNFKIKGNIDLITRYSDGLIQITDYKTGRRINWGSDLNEKDYKKFENDPQLKIYYYALANLYPKDDIIISIYYVNDGGIFSIPFDRSQLPEIEDMLRKRFLAIQNNKKPKLLSASRSHWKCKKLCAFSKEFKDGKCLCELLSEELKINSIDKVTEEYTKDGFDISAYGSGGGREGLK